MSNFIADNIDWLVPIGLIAVSLLFSKKKKNEAQSDDESGADTAPRTVYRSQPQRQAPPRPQPINDFLDELRRLQQSEERRRPRPERRQVPVYEKPVDQVPAEEGVAAVVPPTPTPAPKPIAATSATVHYSARKQRLRRAFVWSQILHRPQF